MNPCPSMYFRTGYLELDGGWPIPTKEAANAVDFCYPSSRRLYLALVRVLRRDRIQPSLHQRVEEIVYAIVDNDHHVRERLPEAMNSESLNVERIERFLRISEFNKKMIRAVCGADHGRFTGELAELIALLARRDRVIADVVDTVMHDKVA